MNTEPKKYHVILTEDQLALLRSTVAVEVDEIQAGLDNPRACSRALRLFFIDRADRLRALEALFDPGIAGHVLPPSALCAHANELLQELKTLARLAAPDVLSHTGRTRIAELIAKAEGQS
jgi:hypothetical protein